MGCGPSRSNNTVHPLDSENTTNLPVEVSADSPDKKPPAAPTSTPEPSEDDPESFPLPPNWADRNRSHWHPRQLQQRQSQWKPDTSISKLGSGSYYSPFAAPGDSSTDRAPPLSLSSSTAMDGVLQHAIRGQAEDARSPVCSSITMESFVRLLGEPLPPSPFISPTPSLHGPSPLRIYATDSQIEFFKMLDRRIDDGPDYTSDSEENR